MVPISMSDGETCAQRLSASRRAAHQGAELHGHRYQVLNAFRHHGGRHHHLRQEPPAQLLVLNAFRHHGGRHHRGVLFEAIEADVLNAFRHHGGRHWGR